MVLQFLLAGCGEGASASEGIPPAHGLMASPPESSRSTSAARISKRNLCICMGDSTPFPEPAAIARAELFTREQFVYEGETLEDALAPGSARRRALDAALAETETGATTPSIEWRRQFSLLLGLERLLSEEAPHLADKTGLSAHQVDALSGTLTALLAEVQRIEVQRSANGNTSTNGSGSANGAGSA